MLDRSRILVQLTPSSAKRLDEAWNRWHELARVLLDACEQPSFVLDPDGFVIAMNESFKHLVGVTMTDHATRGGGFVNAETLARGTSQPGRAFHGTLVHRDGTKLIARLVFRTTGTVGGDLLFVRVEWARRPMDVVPVPSSDHWYVVRTSRAAAGELEVMSARNGALVQPPSGARCYEHVYGRSAPCDGCPFLSEGVSQDTTFARVEGEDKSVVHASAARLGEGSTMILARRLSPSDVGGVIQARIEALAAQRGLSPREREVLKLATIGRSRSDIANVLGITQRTVKHHVANIFAKLGADSQADLLRVLL